MDSLVAVEVHDCFQVSVEELEGYKALQLQSAVGFQSTEHTHIVPLLDSILMEHCSAGMKAH